MFRVAPTNINANISKQHSNFGCQNAPKETFENFTVQYKKPQSITLGKQ